MSDTEEIDTKKFWHRKQCASRVFIGPWDIKAPSPPEQLLPNVIESIHSIESDSSLKMLNYNTFNSEPSIVKDDSVHNTSTPLSDGTSFFTARSSNTNSTIYTSAHSTPGFLDQIINNDEDDDDEIDYHFLAGTTVQQLVPTDEDVESIKTIRPSKGKLPMNPATTTTALSTPTVNTMIKNKKRRVRRHGKKPLVWKKAGSVFISRVPNDVTQDQPVSVPTGKPLKREPILCMRSVSGYVGSEPSPYKAEKEAMFDRLTEEWRQVELVLTDTYISTYSSSTLFWPMQKLEHRIFLNGNKKHKHLKLFLLSPLDYTFCLRYLSISSKIPMVATMTFKARSFLKCQEWYMILYDMLSDESKLPCPKWCEVYIPLLDLSVNLPLTHAKHSDAITMEDVKEAVITVLEEDEGEHIDLFKEKVEALTTEELALCWTTKDRAEWVYWTTSSSDEQQRIDWVICPQSIEQTHRLELRPILHTPNEIILQENFTLKEPPPVEGFLTSVTDFLGRTKAIFTGKTNYYSTFDQFLFYTPASKISAPNITSFIDEELLPRNIRSRPYISGISPYTQLSTNETEVQEIQRRMRLMTEAKTIIDLTEVSYVRRTFSSDLIGQKDTHSQISLGKKTSRSPMIQPEEQETLFKPKPHRNKPCLELIMENGLQIRFEAYSSDTCDLWVTYLAQIIVYWKARKEAEKDAHTHEKFSHQNDQKTASENTLIKDKTQLNTQEGCRHRKQERIADTRIWSYCLYEQCRDIVKSGTLYYKPHNRGTYSQKMFILTASGWILFYDVFNRSITKKTSGHDRKGALDIAGCYFYSGSDNKKEKKGVNSDDLWKKTTRIYKTGLTTDDDKASCIFSIWKPKLRCYFSGKRQRLRVYRQDQKINPNGNTWTFLAKSRREKEEWVCALNTVTEHMIRCETR